MIIDAHTHIFPPEITNNRAPWLTGEPDFAFIYENPAARLVTAENLVEALDRWGADMAVTFGFPFTDTGKSATVNDYVIGAAKEHPGHIIPFACVNPLMGKPALKELERAIARGAKGVGELAAYKAGLGPEVRKALKPVAELCREAGVPLLLHANEPVGHNYPGKSPMEVSDLYTLISENQETTWILAHMGGGLFFYETLKKEVTETLRNVHYDTSASPFLYKPEIHRRFIEIAGAQKLVHGTDYPLLEQPRYEKDYVTSGLTIVEKAAVMGGNMARILGINGR